MGAVRIYKAPYISYGGDVYFWRIQSDNCLGVIPEDCDFGEMHGGYCKGFRTFTAVVTHLNDPNTRLGAYLKK